MTEKEKALLKNIKAAIPKMSDSEKERLFIFGEAIGMIADSGKSAEENVDGEQKPA